jgi:hypothetical protein
VFSPTFTIEQMLIVNADIGINTGFLEWLEDKDKESTMFRRLYAVNNVGKFFGYLFEKEVKIARRLSHE